MSPAEESTMDDLMLLCIARFDSSDGVASGTEDTPGMVNMGFTDA